MKCTHSQAIQDCVSSNANLALHHLDPQHYMGAIIMSVQTAGNRITITL